MDLDLLAGDLEDSIAGKLGIDLTLQLFLQLNPDMLDLIIQEPV